MAKERDRIFSLSRFTTMADEGEAEDSNNIHSLVYGYNDDRDNAGGFGGVGADEINLEDDTNYVEPRTSYPANAGITGFDKV